MSKPCRHEKEVLGCRVCWLFVQDDGYRRLWGGSAAPQPAGSGGERQFGLGCFHLGEVIDRTGCNCPGKWVRKCGIHGRTTISDCKQCSDYEEE